MPDIATYTFGHRELLELLIKASAVHEGEWMLQMTFGFTAGNFGPTDAEMNPGGITMVTQVGITRAKEGMPTSLVLNAAAVNPPPST